MRPFTARPLRNLFVLFCFSLVFTPASSSADSSLDDAVLEFAGRVVSIPNLHGPVRLQFLQEPRFQSETGKEWQTLFSKEIENRHIAIREDDSADLLRVGLAETPTEIILSASVQIAGKDEVRFLSIPRSSFRAASLPVAPVRIERQLVYQSADRILDASPLADNAGSSMAILVSRDLALSLLRIDSRGNILETVPVTAAPYSRSPRAELLLHANEISVVLPTRTCDLAWASASPANCRNAKPVWRTPLVLTPSCDPGGWKLQSNGEDWTTPESLEVVPATSARQGSAALLSDFPGPVFSISAGPDPASALVVSRNLRTGNYEVYKITLACGN